MAWSGVAWSGVAWSSLGVGSLGRRNLGTLPMKAPKQLARLKMDLCIELKLCSLDELTR